MLSHGTSVIKNFFANYRLHEGEIFIFCHVSFKLVESLEKSMANISKLLDLILSNENVTSWKAYTSIILYAVMQQVQHFIQSLNKKDF